ncbi:alpha-1,6-mannosyltransferase [Ekhidna lutea]|uniref:Alpha-1,6-mannosyltransferase n=1 Tax=Ekhidna lutea TaxID=447679 RepID=A0A239FTW9_EKHLU|nr:glycosyltransferase [Ekhidna lutea]SNS59354.1 alpha-1,6-mannosyltransferase [Ekhidna lutea]
MHCIIDCNNFWSPNGGGVRRYHLEKLNFYKERSNIRYVFVMNDDKTYTEQIASNTFIEHLEVKQPFRNDGYKNLLDAKKLEHIFLKYNPDVIEVGSPFFLPKMVNSILKKNKLKAKVFGFWHNDFPVTSFKRNFQFAGSYIAGLAEKLGWLYARKRYNKMDGIMVSSRLIGDRMKANGIYNIIYLPLGVDLETFNHQERGNADTLKNDRISLFFAHRLNKEKGIDLVLKAYPKVCKYLGYEPKLIIAGSGPADNKTKSLANKYANVHYIGYLSDKSSLAKHYREADLCFALSQWETFGLSILEAYACGAPVIAASDGAAREHATNSGVPLLLKKRNSEELAILIRQFAESKERESQKNSVINYAKQFTWKKCFEKQLQIYESHLVE